LYKPHQNILADIMVDMCDNDSTFKYCSVDEIANIECPKTRSTEPQGYNDVLCDQEGKMTGFSTFETHFGGTIPTQFALLTDLTMLFAVIGNLQGTLPSELNLLTNLATLGFGTNKLSGTLPNLRGLTKLVNVYLDNNMFVGDANVFRSGLNGKW
jgi:Leucine-rich repeat (LRR) protein